MTNTTQLINYALSNHEKSRQELSHYEIDSL